jgi:hypothetical protein
MWRKNDDDDDHRVLRDGERRRIPMIMRDENSLSPLQRAIMQDAHETGRDRILSNAMDARTQVVDAFGNGGLALQRPGPRYLSSPEHSTRDEIERAYREREQQDSNAWRGLANK